MTFENTLYDVNAMMESLLYKKQIDRLNVELVPVETIEDVIKYVWGKEEVLV